MNESDHNLLSIRSKLAIKRPISGNTFTSYPISKKPHTQSVLLPVHNRKKSHKQKSPAIESHQSSSSKVYVPLNDIVSVDNEATKCSADQRPTHQSSDNVVDHRDECSSVEVKRCIICMKDLTYESELSYISHVNSCIDTNGQSIQTSPSTITTTNHIQEQSSIVDTSVQSKTKIAIAEKQQQPSKAKRTEERRNNLIAKLIDENPITTTKETKQALSSSATVKLKSHFTSAAGVITKDEMDLQRLRTDLADLLAKQAELKVKEKKIKTEIKKILKKSSASLSLSSIPVSENHDSDHRTSSKQPISLDPQQLEKIFPTISSAAIIDFGDPLILEPKQQAESCQSDLKCHVWNMSQIDSSFDSTCITSKFRADHFQILTIPEVEESTSEVDIEASSAMNVDSHGSLDQPPDTIHDVVHPAEDAVDEDDTHSDVTQVDEFLAPPTPPYTQDQDVPTYTQMDNRVSVDMMWTQIVQEVSDEMYSMIPSTQIY